MAKKIMFQGTSSNVGKSVLTTALCRIFYRQGMRVAPFKAQNMALNSYVTKWGDEIGRAQVAQAEAAKTEPIVQMNPVLLKPTGNQSSQVVLMGKPVGTYSAREYHTKYSLTALDKVKESLDYLDKNFDMIVIEGAGSPAEVNLKANDIVNMRVAKMANVPVFLVADIDRGGAIASIVGTLELLEAEERELVKGIVINKFRGDLTLLKPALDFIVEKTGKPILGVIPSIENLDIDEEDSVALESKKSRMNKELEVVVLQTPKISNFTDFDALAYEPDVSLRFIKQGDSIGNPDLIIIPGSKNTIADMEYLYAHGFVADILEKVKGGTPVLGICGGYQMLGEKIMDPYHIEGERDEIEGIGVLASHTVMEKEKNTYQVTFDCEELPIFGRPFTAKSLVGYEIHMGTTTPKSADVKQCFTITKRGQEETSISDGLISADNLVMGSYIHGFLDNDELRRHILNGLREKKGLPPLPVVFKYFEHKDAAYERLADIVDKHIDYAVLNAVLEQ